MPAVSKLVVTIVTIIANIEKVKIGVNCSQSSFVQLVAVWVSMQLLLLLLHFGYQQTPKSVVVGCKSISCVVVVVVVEIVVVVVWM